MHEQFMLKLLDVVLTILHLVIILFNLFGWMFKSTRKLHLVSVMLTAASWFILGIWFGMGYCPLTDWQWNVKEKLGEQNLPSNFIEYFAEKISGTDFSAGLVNTSIGVCFGLAVLLSLYVNFFKRKGIS
jgi:hypothetical protein